MAKEDDLRREPSSLKIAWKDMKAEANGNFGITAILVIVCLGAVISWLSLSV